MLAFEFARLLQLTLAIAVAFTLAALIGTKRQCRQRNAGLCTNMLVAVGAAAVVTIGLRLNGRPAPRRWPPTWCPASASSVPA